MALDYQQRQRIYRDAVLGVPRPANETPEAARVRDQADKEAAQAAAQGVMLDLPFELPEDPEAPSLEDL